MRLMPVAATESDTSPKQRPAAIALAGVSKEYRLDRSRSVRALERIDLEVGEGEFVALLGPSGCGKSTLLRLVASLESPTTGTVLVQGQAPVEMARAHRLGVAFQDHALLPGLSGFDNIALAFQVSGTARPRRRI